MSEKKQLKNDQDRSFIERESFILKSKYHVVKPKFTFSKTILPGLSEDKKKEYEDIINNHKIQYDAFQKLSWKKQAKYLSEKQPFFMKPKSDVLTDEERIEKIIDYFKCKNKIHEAYQSIAYENMPLVILDNNKDINTDKNNLANWRFFKSYEETRSPTDININEERLESILSSENNTEFSKTSSKEELKQDKCLNNDFEEEAGHLNCDKYNLNQLNDDSMTDVKNVGESNEQNFFKKKKLITNTQTEEMNKPKIKKQNNKEIIKRSKLFADLNTVKNSDRSNFFKLKAYNMDDEISKCNSPLSTSTSIYRKQVNQMNSLFDSLKSENDEKNMPTKDINIQCSTVSKKKSIVKNKNRKRNLKHSEVVQNTCNDNPGFKRQAIFIDTADIESDNSQSEDNMETTKDNIETNISDNEAIIIKPRRIVPTLPKKKTSIKNKNKSLNDNNLEKEIQKSQSSNMDSKINDDKYPCPMCNELFLYSKIEEHAELCCDKKEVCVFESTRLRKRNKLE